MAEQIKLGIKDAIDLLLKKAYTTEEIVKLTGLSESTVKVQLQYHIPKKGLYKVEKTGEKGKEKYKLTKV